MGCEFVLSACVRQTKPVSACSVLAFRLPGCNKSNIAKAACKVRSRLVRYAGQLIILLVYFCASIQNPRCLFWLYSAVMKTFPETKKKTCGKIKSSLFEMTHFTFDAH